MKHIKPESTQMKAQDLGMPLDKLFSKKLDRLAACYRWNDDTRAEYERIVERIAQVIKELKGEKSFRDLGFDDYEDGINKMIADYNDSHQLPMAEGTIRKRRMLILQLCHFAECAEIGYYDPTWGCYWINYQHSGSRQQNKTDALKIPRSLSINVETTFVRMLNDKLLDKSGVYMGGMMMLYLGLRCGECCGLKYGDIQQMSDKVDLQVLNVARQMNQQGKIVENLKTSNAYRVMPVPTELVELIERRKQHILAEWGDAIDINDFPVVNDDTAFDEHCPYGTYTNAIKRMLRECKLNEKTFGGAADDLRNMDNDMQEKEPTAYLLRRNFATCCSSICQIVGDDMNYLMGHRLQTPDSPRYEYVNEDKLLELRNKLDRRRLLSLFPNTTVKLGNEPVTCRNVTSQTIYTTGKADITIFTKCPNDPVYVTVQKAPDSAETPGNNPPQVQAIYRPEADGNVERVDTTEAYQAAMRRVFNRQQKNKEGIEKEGLEAD